jgi:uncharacterized membrane protein YkoI
MTDFRRRPALRAACAAALGVSLVSAVSDASAFSGERYSKEAKISLEKARQTALDAFQGKIISEELEREKGGSGLRYSFDIRRGELVHEVGVDAKTGKVLENDREEENPD